MHATPKFYGKLLNYCAFKLVNCVLQVVDNSGAMLNKLSALYENEELSDIELIVTSSSESGTRSVFHGHKIVLCCSSDVLRIMLLNPSWPDSHRHSIELHEELDCVQVCYCC